MFVLILALRSIFLVLGLVARLTNAQFMVAACIGVLACTLQEALVVLCTYDLYAFAYGWTELAYRFIH